MTAMERFWADETFFYHKDRTAGLLASLAFHAFLVFSAGVFLSEPVAFGVRAGQSVGEVLLDVAFSDRETVMLAERSEAVVPATDEPEEETPAFERLAQVPAIQAAQPPVVFAASDPGIGSGTTAGPAEPEYLRNPAPRYPDLSRRLGEEGLVVLSVRVGRDGSAGSVRVFRSSGFPRLDEAAERAVRRWRFKPARAAGIAVETEADVPVRFQLSGVT